jgi:hypothetical protein
LSETEISARRIGGAIMTHSPFLQNPLAAAYSRPAGVCTRRG